MRRLALAVSLVGVLTAACGDDNAADTPPTEAATSPSTVADTATATSTTTVVDPNDARPVLTEGYWVSGPPPLYQQPKDLHNTYVYPDGRVIRVLFDNDSAELSFEEYAIGPSALAALLDLTSRAGLKGGGLALVPLPPGVEIMDGGSTVFTARTGDTLTGRIIEQLGMVDPESAGERGAFWELRDALFRCCAQQSEQAEVTTPTRWVIVSEPADQPGYADADDWTGPDLTQVEWTAIGDDEWCVVVDVEHWPIGLWEARAPTMVIDDRTVTRRPLLPHEHDCADVDAFRRLLDL